MPIECIGIIMVLSLLVFAFGIMFCYLDTWGEPTNKEKLSFIIPGSVFCLLAIWLSIANCQNMEIAQEIQSEIIQVDFNSGSKVQIALLNEELINITEKIKYFVPKNAILVKSIYKKTYYGILFKIPDRYYIKGDNLCLSF